MGENLTIIIIIIIIIRKRKRRRRNKVLCVVDIKYVTPTPYNGSHCYNICKIHRRNNTA